MTDLVDEKGVPEEFVLFSQQAAILERYSLSQESPIGQNLDVQLDKLREYGCEETFQEKRSGRTAP